MSSENIFVVVITLACIIFPTILCIVAFCMMIRMSEDIRLLRIKDDPMLNKKPMPYWKVIVSCFAVAVILSVLLAAPTIASITAGTLKLPMQQTNTASVSTFKG